MHDLGEALRDARRFGEAEARLRSALEMTAKVDGESDVTTLMMIASLTDCLLQHAVYDVGEDFNQEKLREAAGEGHEQGADREDQRRRHDHGLATEDAVGGGTQQSADGGEADRRRDDGLLLPRTLLEAGPLLAQEDHRAAHHAH